MIEQINLHIADGEPFYAHEVTCNFTPTQLIVDFKCITPRTDPRSKKPSFQLKHNVVMLDTWQAAQLHGVLGNVLAKYEDQFGKIKKPAAVAKVEKKQKAAKKSKKSADKVEAPTYLG